MARKATSTNPLTHPSIHPSIESNTKQIILLDETTAHSFTDTHTHSLSLKHTDSMPQAKVSSSSSV